MDFRSFGRLLRNELRKDFQLKCHRGTMCKSFLASVWGRTRYGLYFGKQAREVEVAWGKKVRASFAVVFGRSGLFW